MTTHEMIELQRLLNEAYQRQGSKLEFDAWLKESSSLGSLSPVCEEAKRYLNWQEERSHYMTVANNCGAVERATNLCNWGFVAGWILGQWDIHVGADWVKEVHARKIRGQQHWSDGTWALFWKTQLIEAALIAGAGSQGGPTITVPVPLHIFFLWLEESPEMLARLRRPDHTKPAGPSTPGIERVMTNPQPIDRTAALVVQGET